MAGATGPSGLVTTDHAVPSQDSTSVSEPDEPTAVQELADTHDTLSRSLLLDDAPFGLVTIDQVLPFHDSAWLPPATQKLAVGQDTAVR